MPMQEYNNVKGFTFVQDTEPSQSKSREHDTWYNTSNNKIYMFQNYRWKMFVNAIYFPGADYGYSCGGDSDANASVIERITFPFDSGVANYVGNLSSSKFWTSSCNSSNYGYCMGGHDGTNYLSTIERITFPFDSGVANYVGNLSDIRNALSGCNSSNYGYCMGGWNGTNYLSTIDRITFPFDSGVANYVGNLNATQYNSHSGCNSSNYGYCCSGWNGGGSFYSTIDRITFPFDSGTAIHVGNLSGTNGVTSAINSSNYGYICGGYTYDSSRINLSIIDRITFPFDSGTAIHVGNLNGTRNGMCACNSSNYGYCMGGYDGTNKHSTIDRMTFPFDSGTAIHVGNLNTVHNSGPAGIDGTDFVTLFDNPSDNRFI